jgi:hypothetical protein
MDFCVLIACGTTAKSTSKQNYSKSVSQQKRKELRETSPLAAEIDDSALELALPVWEKKKGGLRVMSPLWWGFKSLPAHFSLSFLEQHIHFSVVHT